MNATKTITVKQDAAAKAPVLPALPNIPSRKFYKH